MDKDLEIISLIKEIISMYRQAGLFIKQGNEGNYINTMSATGSKIKLLKTLLGDTFEFSHHWLTILEELQGDNDRLSTGYLYKLHGDLLEEISNDLAGKTLTARIYFLAGEYLEAESIYTEAAYCYHKARNYYSQTQDWDSADSSYLRHLICHRKELPKLSLQRLKAGIFELTTGYGYRPFRLLVTTLLTIALFSCIYWVLDLTGGQGTGEQKTFWNYIYFSGITFLTIGYGDIVPISIPAKIISVIEGFIGLGSYSLFIAMMARKFFKY